MSAILLPASASTIRCATPADDARWDAFVFAHPEHLSFYTTAYRDFLLRVCGGSTAHYLITERDGEIVGVLPALLSAAGSFGPVLNSLSFYGSHGAPLVAMTAPDRAEIAAALVRAFDDLADSTCAAASTIVSNPLDMTSADLLRARAHDCTDHRIGQLTMLPADPGDEASRDAVLLAMYSGKRRNQVRKTLGAGLEVRVDNSAEALDAVADLHRTNLASIGGLAKPATVFRALGDTMRAGAQREVWVARHDGAPIAYLLVLHTGRVVEYFTPCVRAEFRALQPLTLLIHHAMRDALRRGARVWNWGGTWTSQAGVYEFKRGWGTCDMPYDYFTRVHDRRLFDATPAQLLAGYPNFYTLPFNRLTRI